MTLSSPPDSLLPAVILHDQGQYQSALFQCKQVLMRSPHLVAGYQLLGDILTALGRHAQATVAYQQAQQLNGLEESGKREDLNNLLTADHRTSSSQAIPTDPQNFSIPAAQPTPSASCSETMRQAIAAATPSPQEVQSQTQFLKTLLFSDPSVSPSAINQPHSSCASSLLVFDVGTNLGQKADIYLAMGARVICFEPNPDLVTILHEKYRNRPDVVIVNRGVAQQAGQLTLNICTESPVISTFSQQWQQGRFAGQHQWDRAATVETMTLDAAISIYGCPQFCKIDVEGFEYEVLLGLSQPIPLLCFEFACEGFMQAQQCLARLYDLGYTQFNFSQNSQASFTLGKWSDRLALLEWLQATMQTDQLLWGDIYARWPDAASW